MAENVTLDPDKGQESLHLYRCYNSPFYWIQIRIQSCNHDTSTFMGHSCHSTNTRPFDQECIKGSPRRPLDKHYHSLSRPLLPRKFAERAVPGKKYLHSTYRRLEWKWAFSMVFGVLTQSGSISLVFNSTFSCPTRTPHMHKKCCVGTRKETPAWHNTTATNQPTFTLQYVCPLHNWGGQRGNSKTENVLYK